MPLKRIKVSAQYFGLPQLYAGPVSFPFFWHFSCVKIKSLGGMLRSLSSEKESKEKEEVLFLVQWYTNTAVKDQRKQSVSPAAEFTTPEVCYLLAFS